MRRVVLGMDGGRIVELAVSHAGGLFQELAAPARDRLVSSIRLRCIPDTGGWHSQARDRCGHRGLQPTPEKKCIINHHRLPTVEHRRSNILPTWWSGRTAIERAARAIALSSAPAQRPRHGHGGGRTGARHGRRRPPGGCLFGNGDARATRRWCNVAPTCTPRACHPGLDLSDIDAIRSTVGILQPAAVHPRHPYVGDLVYTSFSGRTRTRSKGLCRAPGRRHLGHTLPIDWDLTWAAAYEAVIRVNSQSGKGGIAPPAGERVRRATYRRRLQIEFSQAVQHRKWTPGQGSRPRPTCGRCSRRNRPAWRPLAAHRHRMGTKAGKHARLGACSGRATPTWKAVAPIDAFVQAFPMDRGLRVLDYQAPWAEGQRRAVGLCGTARRRCIKPFMAWGLMPHRLTPRMRAIPFGRLAAAPISAKFKLPSTQLGKQVPRRGKKPETEQTHHLRTTLRDGEQIARRIHDRTKLRIAPQLERLRWT